MSHLYCDEGQWVWPERPTAPLFEACPRCIWTGTLPTMEVVPSNRNKGLVWFSLQSFSNWIWVLSLLSANSLHLPHLSTASPLLLLPGSALFSSVRELSSLQCPSGDRLCVHRESNTLHLLSTHGGSKSLCPYFFLFNNSHNVDWARIICISG